MSYAGKQCYLFKDGIAQLLLSANESVCSSFTYRSILSLFVVKQVGGS